MEKLIIPQTVIVEGKYDKIKLSSVIDAKIITLDGFGIFNNAEKIALLRRIAETRGIIILTDSDPAGFFLRGKLKGMLPTVGVTHLYTPGIKGKERRKAAPSKAGLLGVEGISADTLRSLFAPFASNAKNISNENPVTKTDFYVNGLSGGVGSTEKRRKLAAFLGLPPDMTANALLEAMNLLGKSLPNSEVWE